MKLSELIEKLQTEQEKHGDMQVEFTIPAHENSYESDYFASEVVELDVFNASGEDCLFIVMQ